jgi:aspartate aminotransferase
LCFELRTFQSYFDEVISEYRERRDTLVAELEKIAGVKVANQKSFYCIAELPIDNADHFAQWLLEVTTSMAKQLWSRGSRFYSTQV